MRQGGGGQYDMVSASGDAEPAADLRRRRPAGRTSDLIPDWKDFIPQLKSPPHNTVDGKHYGDLAAVGPEHAALQHEDGHAGADELGGDLRPEVQGQDHGPGQPDPDRRRGAVPVEDAAGPRHHRPVRAEPEAARRGGRPAEAAAAAGQEVLGARLGRDRPVQERRRRRSAPPGRTRRARSATAKVARHGH